MEQPEIASELGKRKAESIVATGAQALAAGNIGCLVQIQNRLAAAGHPLPVYHTIQVLALSYQST
jgi:glycolate oxidase iron-sulfur subunit